MPDPIIINEGDEDEARIPTRWEMCHRCRGEGTHDAWEGGMTQSEMDEQGPEFLEDYLNGMYSVPCTVCAGNRVVAVPDEDLADPKDLERYRQILQWEGEDRQIRRMESGYW